VNKSHQQPGLLTGPTVEILLAFTPLRLASHICYF
jgi:hypothetical protein